MTLYPDWKRRALFCAALFLIVFNPPVLKKLSFTMAFSALAFADLALHYGEAKALVLRLRKPFLVLLSAFAWYLVVCLVNSLLYPDRTKLILVDFAETFANSLCQMFISLSILRIASRRGYGTGDLIRFFLVAGAAQAVLGVMCFVLPPVKSFLNGLMIQNAGSESFASVIRANSYRRNYGFASTLFDVFGFAMSILSVTAFCRAYVSRRRIDYLFCLAITVVAVLNARTGIVLIAAGVLLCILLAYNRRMNGMDLAKKAAAAAVIAAAGWMVVQGVQGSESATASWLASGIEQITALFQGEKTGIFSTMSSEFVFFPDSLLATVFGTALTPMEILGRNTDMGYIQCIWRYGIIGAALSYGFWIALCRQAYRNRANETERVIVIVLAALQFIYQLKLNTWGYSMSGTIFYPVLMSIALGTRQPREREEFGEQRQPSARYGDHKHLQAV